MIHELKIWPEYWAEVRCGMKTFEVRVNDRDYQEGDIVRLTYFDPKTGELRTDYPYDTLNFEIGYIYRFEGENHLVVFSLLELSKRQKTDLEFIDFEKKLKESEDESREKS